MKKSQLIINVILIGIGYSLMIETIIHLINFISSGLLIYYINNMKGGVATSGNNPFIYDLITKCMIAPIVEEFIFRLLILKTARHYLPFKWANVLQAFLFAITHGQIFQMAIAFIIGLLMGYVYNKYKTIYYAMLIHINHNIMVLMVPYINILFAPIKDPLFLNIISILIHLSGTALFWIGFKKVKNDKVNNIVPEFTQ